MTTYDRYKDARDLAWRVLIKNGLTDFPLNIFGLVRLDGVRLIPYADALSFFREFNIKPEKNAFAYVARNKRYIFFDSSRPKCDQRFYIAHEYGHLLMNHITAERRRLDSYTESEANIFASRVLTPSIVSLIEALKSVTAFMDFFGVSEQTATIRFERFNGLVKRNVFCKSPLEAMYKKLYLEAKNAKS